MALDGHPAKRRALGSLDPNRDLSRRVITGKRAPITSDIENEDAVLDGIALGVYDLDEVLAYTNQQLPAPLATSSGPVESESDDEQPLATLAAPGSYGVLEERPVEDFQEEYDEEMLDEDSEGEYEDEGQEPPVEGVEGDDVEGEDEDHVGYFDPTSMGLKEINNLAHFGVSSHKPGNGVEELLSDDLDKYWQ
jgi:anaphase-promoting complex subunit 10